MTKLVGFINFTPDSFSDGGQSLEPKLAAKLARSLFLQGATIFDIGAESTHPGSEQISPLQEWECVEPALQAIQNEFAAEAFKPLMSIDT